MPITMAARSEARTVFACSNTRIAGSNSTRGTDVCARLFCVCVVLCVGRGLATVYRIKKVKCGQGPTKGCRAIAFVTFLSYSSQMP
jgi:hypothetical protein